MIAQNGKRDNRKGKEGEMRNLAVGILLAVAIFVGSSNAFAYWQGCGMPVEVNDPMPNPYGADWTAMR